MYRSTFTLILISALVASEILVSCKKENNVPGKDNEVVFSVAYKENNAESMKKSSISDAQKIILTITKSDGSDTKYKESELKLYKIGNSLSSEKITLKSGSYKLVLFVLADNSNNILYAAPTADYNFSYENPLPILFTVSEGGITEVNVEVISTDKKSPEQFGLTTFNISPKFKLYIEVYSKELNRLISAKLTVSSGSYSLTKFLSVNNNELYVKEGFKNYKIVVERPGYNSYTGDFTFENLKATIQNALRVELSCIEIVTDNEGNIYSAVKIGNQTWLGQNLATGHFNNGDKIPTLIDSGQVIVKPVSTWEVSPENIKYTGRYYTYHAMMDNRGICPKGWHIPTVKEWNILINYLGGDSIAGAKLKEKGGPFSWYEYFFNNEQFSTNESGFSALSLGKYVDLTYNGEGGWSTHFWAADIVDSTSAYGFGLSEGYKSIDLISYSFRYDALNVRCIKD